MFAQYLHEVAVKSIAARLLTGNTKRELICPVLAFLHWLSVKTSFYIVR